MVSNNPRKIVVVNDCAHVMEDLIPLLRDTFEISFLRRTRGWWSKTFGILWKILRAKGDLFHVNYALQDAYLVSKFKRRLDVLHVHGSDIRWSFNSRRYHRIVKSDLLSAKKVLYSTPDLECKTKELRPDAIYLPNPIRTELFRKKVSYNNPLRAVYFKLGYEKFPKELGKVLNDHGIVLNILDRSIAYPEMPQTLASYDIYIDRMTIDSFSKTCLEAMSSGLATVDYRHKNDFRRRVEQIADTSRTKSEGENNRNYVVQEHSASVVAEKLKAIYLDLLSQK